MTAKSQSIKKTARNANQKPANRIKDAQATRRNILDEAQKEFSEYGLSGARVDRIAEKTRTSKRMIYYYFDGKDGLYCEVLRESYKQLRELEANFHLEDLPPMLALRKLTEGTVDYHASHADFIRVIMTENIHRGEHIRKLPELRTVNRKAIEIIEDIVSRGIAEGIFRSDLEPVKLHENISALAFFNVSNRYTFGFLFDQDFDDVATHARRRDQIVDTITRYARAP